MITIQTCDSLASDKIHKQKSYVIMQMTNCNQKISIISHWSKVCIRKYTDQNVLS